MDRTTMRSKQIRIRVNPEEDKKLQDLKVKHNYKKLSQCLRDLAFSELDNLTKEQNKNKQLEKTLKSFKPIFQLVNNMPFDEFNQLMWKYVYSDLKQKEYEEIEREIYEEDTEEKNRILASNFAGFKPKSSPKRKHTQTKRKRKSTTRKSSTKRKK